MMGRRRTRGLNARNYSISHRNSLSSTVKSQNSVSSTSSSRSGTGREYPIRCILEESQRRYLIAWEGPYQPTWEPKHFVNKAAVRVWDRKKDKRLAACQRYQNSKPSRHPKQVQRDSDFGSSGHSTLPSTIPESQTTAASGEAFTSDSTQRSSREGLSQASSLGGSIFLPDTQSVESLLSGVSCTQSQQSFSQSTDPSSQITSQNLSQPALGLSSSDSSIVSSTLRILALSNSQIPSSVVQGTGTQQTTSAQSETCPFSPRRRGNIAHYYRSARQLLSEGNGLSPYSRNREAEIEETPQSQLLVWKSQDLEGRHSQILISGTHNPPEAVCTPSRLLPRQAQTRNSITVQSIPETVYRSCSSPKPNLRLSRSHSNPEDSPSAPVPSSRRRHSLTQETTSTDLFYRPVIEDDSLFQPLPLVSQAEGTCCVIENMDDPSSHSNTPSRRNLASESVRSTAGQVLKDRLSALRRVDQEAVRPLQSMSGSATPSSAGDIEPTAAPANPPTASPLSVRVDKEHPVHETRTDPTRSSSVPPFIAPQALHYDVEHADIVPGLVNESGPNLTEAGELGLPTASLEETADTVDKYAANYGRSPSPEIRGIGLTPSEFAIPLPMDSRVKDDYDKALDREAKTITKFLEVSDREALIESEGQSIVSRLRKMVDQLGNVCTHPDLNLEDPPPVNVNDIAREASWAEYSSSKFLFLGHFIDAADTAQNHDIHVIVMVKNARTAKTMETYFLGKGFSLCVTPSESSAESEMIFYRGSLSFAIRITSDNRLTESFKSSALLVAWDNSFDVDSESVRQLRATDTPGQLVPVVRLVIANTVEHIQLCLPDCSDLMRLRLLVMYANIYCDNAGELQDDALGVQEDAEEILAYLTAEPPSVKWPLPMIEALEIEIPEGTPSNPEPEELRSMTSSGQKRWLEGEEDETINPTKRQRVTPLQDITHISDSVKGQTQELNVATRAPEETRADASSEELAQEVEKLRSALDQTRERLTTTETGFARLQHRFETKHKQLHKTRQDLDAALEGAKKSTTRIEKQRDEISKLKEEKFELSKQLEEARNVIKEGGGTPAEMEKSQEDSRRLTAENEKLQRTVQQERSQSEYTRQQYQNASSAGAQSALELRQAEEEIEELKHKASDEARRLKELRLKNDAKAHLERIDELERTLMSREALLTKKDEEIDEMKKNRHATRSTSMQPRSPKWGSSRPASPGPNSTPNPSAPRGNSALRFRAEA